MLCSGIHGKVFSTTVRKGTASRVTSRVQVFRYFHMGNIEIRRFGRTGNCLRFAVLTAVRHFALRNMVSLLLLHKNSVVQFRRFAVVFPFVLLPLQNFASGVKRCLPVA